MQRLKHYSVEAAVIFILLVGLAGCQSTTFNGTSGDGVKTPKTTLTMNQRRQVTFAKVRESSREKKALAETAIRETHKGDVKGQVAVIENILNRVVLRYGGKRTVRGVVHAKGRNKAGRMVWQYDCYRPSQMKKRKVTKAEMKATLKVVEKILRDPMNKRYMTAARKVGRKSTNYHATYVNPRWAKKSARLNTAAIGGHLFYDLSRKSSRRTMVASAKRTTPKRVTPKPVQVASAKPAPAPVPAKAVAPAPAPERATVSTAGVLAMLGYAEEAQPAAAVQAITASMQ